MDAGQLVIRVTPAERIEGERTPGMTREQAVAVPGMWAGLVRTEAHMSTGWHHHADYDTSIFVVSGSLRMESGPGGVLAAVPGPRRERRPPAPPARSARPRYVQAGP
jgi:quercetin dioxygenase-like cupin family protein